MKTNINDIPEKEKWLYKNKEALHRVQRGLEQAKKGQIRKSEMLKKYVKFT